MTSFDILNSFSGGCMNPDDIDKEIIKFIEKDPEMSYSRRGRHPARQDI